MLLERNVESLIAFFGYPSFPIREVLLTIPLIIIPTLIMSLIRPDVPLIIYIFSIIHLIGSILLFFCTYYLDIKFSPFKFLSSYVSHYKK